MLDTTTYSQLETLCETMTGKSFLVVTGAGISTASGIPDYRDKDGVRRGKQPMMYQEFVGNPLRANVTGRGRCWAGRVFARRRPMPRIGHWLHCRLKMPSAD